MYKEIYSSVYYYEGDKGKSRRKPIHHGVSMDNGTFRGEELAMRSIGLMGELFDNRRLGALPHGIPHSGGFDAIIVTETTLPIPMPIVVLARPMTRWDNVEVTSGSNKIEIASTYWPTGAPHLTRIEMPESFLVANGLVRNTVTKHHFPDHTVEGVKINGRIIAIDNKGELLADIEGMTPSHMIIFSGLHGYSSKTRSYVGGCVVFDKAGG